MGGCEPLAWAAESGREPEAAACGSAGLRLRVLAGRDSGDRSARHPGAAKASAAAEYASRDQAASQRSAVAEGEAVDAQEALRLAWFDLVSLPTRHSAQPTRLHLKW